MHFYYIEEMNVWQNKYLGIFCLNEVNIFKEEDNISLYPEDFNHLN